MSSLTENPSVGPTSNDVDVEQQQQRPPPVPQQQQPPQHPELSSSGQEAMRRTMKIINAFLARPDSTPFREPVDWRGLELYDYPDIIRVQMDLGTVKRNMERRKYPNAAHAAHDIRLVWKNCMTYNAVGSDFWVLAKGYAKRFEDRYRRIRNEYDVGDEPDYSEEEQEEKPAPNNANTSDEDMFGSDEDDQQGDEVVGDAGGRRTEQQQHGDDDDEDDDEEEEFDGGGTKSEASSPTGSGKQRSGTPPPKLDARAKFASNLALLNGQHLGHLMQMLESKCANNVLEAGPKLVVPERMEINVDAIEPDVFSAVSAYVNEKAVKRRKVMPHPRIEDVSNRRTRK